MVLAPDQSRPAVALIGVTGYGSIYLHLVRDALKRGEIRLVAAVIINRHEVPAITAELAAQGARIYDSSDAFFAQEAGNVDLCMIPVGIAWHARLTIAALKAGMHVLVEKPLAGSVADAGAVRAAEKETGRWVAVGFQDLYSTETAWLKAQLLAGVVGRVESIRMVGLWPRPSAYFSRNGWAGRVRADDAAVLDSPLNNAFAHFVNLGLFFAGTSVESAAEVEVDSAELFRAHEIEMFDTAVVRGHSPEGVRFWFGVSHATTVTRQPEILIQGTEGRIEWWHEQRCVVQDGKGRRQIFPLPTTEHTRELMFQAVLGRLRDPSQFVCTTAIAEKHTRLVEGVQRVGEVRPFDSGEVRWVREAGSESPFPMVHNLAERINSAYACGSELALAEEQASLQSSPR